MSASIVSEKSKIKARRNKEEVFWTGYTFRATVRRNIATELGYSASNSNEC